MGVRHSNGSHVGRWQASSFANTFRTSSFHSRLGETAPRPAKNLHVRWRKTLSLERCVAAPSQQLRRWSFIATSHALLFGFRRNNAEIRKDAAPVAATPVADKEENRWAPGDPGSIVCRRQPRSVPLVQLGQSRDVEERLPSSCNDGRCCFFVCW